MFFVAFIFTAFGTALASKMTDMQAFPLIMNFLVMPLFFLSGSLFPVNSVPKAIEVIVKINPLSYGVDGLRHALLGIGNFSFLLDFFVMFDVAIILGVIGTYFFSQIEA